MQDKWSRRHVLGGLAAGTIAASSGKVWAQAKSPGNGLLARLRAAKKVTVGLANQMPFSMVNPDGSLTGCAPTIAERIMTRLGVPQTIGVAATYGQLIPGMQAGRWDFIAAALTITRVRCKQVLYSDPLLFDGGAFVTLEGAFADPPKLVVDLVERKLVVGVSAGGAHARFALKAGMDPTHLEQFPGDVGIIDGLLAKRIQVAFGSNASLANVYRARKIAVDVIFPIKDDPSNGAACAFRLTDTDLHGAFQEELRAMKHSGEWLPVTEEFGFTTPPDMMFVTSDKLCGIGA